MAEESVEDKYYKTIIAEFLVMTFGISWLTWSLMFISGFGNYFLILWIAVLGLYGPSIAGMIMAYRHHGTWWQHYLPKFKLIIPIFIVAYSLAIGYMYRLSRLVTAYNDNLTLPVIILISICSVLTAYYFSVMIRAPPGFETRNETPFQFSSQAGMIGFALVLPLGIGVGSYFLLTTLVPSYNSFSLIELAASFQLPVYLISFSFLFSGATNEEIGWRGYLTPKLLQKYSPLVTGLLIGIIWSIWHLPLHLAGFYAGGPFGIFYRLLWNVPLGIVFTWYYIKSGYNLLGAIVLHGSYNLFSFIGVGLLIPAYIITAVIMVYESKMWISDRLKKSTKSKR